MTPHLCSVCSGNTRRSPMATLVSGEHLRQAGLTGVDVSGAGRPWESGEPPDRRARTVLTTPGHENATPGVLRWIWERP